LEDAMKTLEDALKMLKDAIKMLEDAMKTLEDAMKTAGTQKTIRTQETSSWGYIIMWQQQHSTGEQVYHDGRIASQQ
jgi:hypothetical protein